MYKPNTCAEKPLTLTLLCWKLGCGELMTNSILPSFYALCNEMFVFYRNIRPLYKIKDYYNQKVAGVCT